MDQAEVRTGQKTSASLHVRTRWLQAKHSFIPGESAWHGAAFGALGALIVILFTAAYGLFGQAAPLHFIIGALLFVASFGLFGLVLTLIWEFLHRIPWFYTLVLACSLPPLALMALTAVSVSIGIFAAGFGMLILASIIGASLSGLAGGGWHLRSGPRRAFNLGFLGLSLVAITAGSYWLLDSGTPLDTPPNAAALSGMNVKQLAITDPSEPGPYRVRTLYYGSGSDMHRMEYGRGVDIVTTAVDGSALIEGWSNLRKTYWGFGPEALPLNGRVWYPEGKGPFPLVLIVHGQHPMEDFSDSGYAYLGDLLASRGYLVTSVDENFLNLSPLVDMLILQSLKEENDLRGWLLLEHLRLWRDWNSKPKSLFYQKVDLDRIALIGHSRGGEAVTVAAVFNRLPCAPNDSSLRFDYNFNIRSLVGIAPVEGTTMPGGQEIVLENINYLVLHGAHDMDVFTFQGSRQYQRVYWTDDGDWIKSAIYIYGANHGQFNTQWGRKDLFEPIMRVYNLEQLIPVEEQQRVAKVTISAFLETTLQGETTYRAFLQDLRRGNDWLPDTIYLHQYQDSQTQMVSTYEEDIDLTTTTLSGGRLFGANFTLWREKPAQAKWGNLGNQVVYLGWVEAENPATYTIQVPANGLAMSEESVLVFAMADANEDPLPGMEGVKTPVLPKPIDLTVEVIDRAGEVARLPLSHFSLLQPQLDGQLGKVGFMSLFPASEAVLQHFEFPLKEFVRANPAFHPADLAAVRFLFNHTPSGVIVLDNIGFRSVK
jgi:dienelactone hydrolase